MRRRRVQNKPPVGQTSQRDGAPEHKGLPASLSDQEITAEGDISERITSRDPAKEGDSHGGIEERTLSEPPEESTPNEPAGESIPIKSAEETVQSEATRGVTSGSNPGHEITSNSESAEEIPPQSESAQEITLKSESGIMPKIKSTHRSGRKPTGAMLIKMIEAVERMSEDQKAKHITQAGFPPWAAANFNRPHLNPTRFIRILRNPQWRRILQQYCLTSYGRASLELSIIHRIVNSELDHIWQPKMSKFYELAVVIFPNALSKVTYKDWLKLLAMPVPHQAELIDRAFFPEHAMRGAFVAQESLPKGFLSNRKTPTQKTWVPELGMDIVARRLGFLEQLDHDAYMTAWKNLRERSDGWFESMIDWKQCEANVSSTVVKVLCHINWWYNPLFTPQGGGVAPRKTWAQQIAFDVFRAGDEGDDQHEDRTYGDKESAAEQMIKDLWDLIENSPKWQSQKLQSTADEKPWERYRKSDRYRLVATKYHSRFRVREWDQVLDLCRQYTKKPLQGPMKDLN